MKKTDLPILAIDTDGMELYDKGEEKAYLALFTAFAKEKYEVCKEKVGILGMTPQDVSDLKAADKVREELKKEGKEAICYGMGDGLEAVERASEVGKNIVVSAAALEVAKYLEKTLVRRMRSVIRQQVSWFRIWTIRERRSLWYTSR